MLEAKIIIGFTILFMVLFLLIIGKLSLLDVVVFLIPFRAISFDVGLAFNTGQLAAFSLLAVLLTIRIDKLVFNKYLIIYLAYCIISTIIISLFYMSYIEVKFGNFFREEGRFISQIILKLFFVYGLMIAISNSIFSISELKRSLRMFTFSITLLLALGLVQFIVYRITGIDIMPINRFDNFEKIRTAVFDNALGLVGWLRVCSYGGEPKGLAAIGAVGLSLLIIFRKHLPKLKKHFNLKILLSIVVIILTLSTGGIALTFILCMVAVLLNVLLRGVNWNILHYKVMIPLSVLSFFFIKYYSIITDIFYLRVINRVTSEEGGVEDMDQTILNFINARPEWTIFGSGWGNIHNLTQDFIPDEYRYYMEGTVFTAKSGYLQVISESGFIGLILLFIFQTTLSYRLWVKRKDSGLASSLFIASIIGFFAYLIRSNYVVYEYMIIAGFCIAFLNLQNNKINPKLNYA